MVKHLKIKTTAKSAKSKKNLKTHVNIVLDRSGSMQSCRETTVEGFNEYINSLKADKNGKYFITLTQFDTNGHDASIDDTFTDVPLKKVPELTLEDFQPRGMTPLHDAIGVSVRRMEDSINKKKGVNAVVMMIMTDGHENSSREFDSSSVKSIIKEKENNGWTVAYLGANQDAVLTGATMGITADKSLSYSTKNMRGTFGKMADTTSSRTALYAVSLDSLDAGATQADVTRAFASTAKSALFEKDENDAE